MRRVKKKFILLSKFPPRVEIHMPKFKQNTNFENGEFLDLIKLINKKKQIE